MATDMTGFNWDNRAFFSPQAGIVPASTDAATGADTVTAAMQQGAAQAKADHAAEKQAQAQAAAQQQAQAAAAAQQQAQAQAAAVQQARAVSAAQNVAAGLQQGLLGQVPGDPVTMAQQTLAHRYKKGPLGATQNYMDAQAAGNAAGMQAAHEQAEVIRRDAKAHGIDLDGDYGADRTFAQKQAALADDANDMYSRLVASGTSSGQYYRQLYDKGLSVGMSPAQADTYAAGKAAAYQTQRLADLRAAFYQYGIDGRNAMTQDGAMLLNQMYDEDPSSIMYPSLNFASPITEYRRMAGEESANNALGRTLKYGDAQHNWDIGTIREKGDQTRQSLHTEGQEKRDTIQKQGDVQEAVHTSATNDQIRANNNAAENRVYVMAHTPQPVQSGGGRGGGTNKLSKTDEERANAWQTKYDALVQATEGDPLEAWDKLGDMTDMLNDYTDKGYFTSAEAQMWFGRIKDIADRLEPLVKKAKAEQE